MTTRLVVMNGQKITQSAGAEGQWQVQKVEKAHDIKPGYYNLNAAVPADKSRRHIGAVLCADATAVYQSTSTGIVRHERTVFDKMPEIGSRTAIQYAGDRAVLMAPPLKQSRGLAH